VPPWVASFFLGYCPTCEGYKKNGAVRMCTVKQTHTNGALPPDICANLLSYAVSRSRKMGRSVFLVCVRVRRRYLGIYISAKWFNYFGILMGVAFDWAYWFMTALCFRPCDYAQVEKTRAARQR